MISVKHRQYLDELGENTLISFNVPATVKIISCPNKTIQFEQLVVFLDEVLAKVIFLHLSSNVPEGGGFQNRGVSNCS